MEELAQHLFLAEAKKHPAIGDVATWAVVFGDVARALATNARHEVATFASQVVMGDSTYVQVAFAALAAAHLLPTTPGFPEYLGIKRALLARWEAEQSAKYPVPTRSLADKVRDLFAAPNDLSVRATDGRFYAVRFRRDGERCSALDEATSDEYVLRVLQAGALSCHVRIEGLLTPVGPRLTEALVEQIWPFTRLQALHRARRHLADAHRWDRPAPPDDIPAREQALEALEWEMRQLPAGVDLL